MARLLDRRAGGLLLTRVTGRASDLAALTVATVGAWLLWSQLSNVTMLSWFYDHAQYVKSLRDTPLPNPDYDLASLPWKTAQPDAFDRLPGGALALATNAEPFAYQAFASVDTKGARVADIQFEADLESGGATVGLLQSGKWIATSSSQRQGRFADANSVQLGYNRSITVMIANNNPAGRSRLTVKWLRVYFRK